MDFTVPFAVRVNRPRNIFSKTLAVRIVCLTLMLIVATLPLLAQSPSYPDFSSVVGLTRNGNAAQFLPNVLRLNPATTGQVGSAWFNTLQPVSEGFSTTFTFQITPPTGEGAPAFPADGFAFVIQNSAAGLKAIGQAGGAIGYGGAIPVDPTHPGIDNSVAIEFDTYQNSWDPNANHVAVQSCGPNPNTVDHTTTCNYAIATAPVNLHDGSPHTVIIEYNPPAVIPLAVTAQACTTCPPPPGLQVTIDGLQVFESPVQIDLGILNLASTGEGSPFDSAYVGFTGATGSFVENNDILSWTFTSHGSQTITKNNLPANTFTTFTFGSYLYKVRPNVPVTTLSVTEVPTDPATFSAGPNFPTASCIIYDHTGNQCIEFHADCAGATCNNVSYDVVTSYDVPASESSIQGPGFLKAEVPACTPGITFTENIITAFFQTRTDPTTKGSSKPSFSCFVAVQNVTYPPADVDIVNLAKSQVATGSNLTYIIPVLNFGPASAQAVSLTDAIPTGTKLVSVTVCSFANGCSSNQCTVSGGLVSCGLGTVDPFSLRFMVMVVNVTAPAGSTITDTVTSFTASPDPRPADNVATATTLVVNKRQE